MNDDDNLPDTRNQKGPQPASAAVCSHQKELNYRAMFYQREEE